MKTMFMSLIAAYLCGNVYIFIRALQTLSGFSLGGKAEKTEKKKKYDLCRGYGTCSENGG